LFQVSGKIRPDIRRRHVDLPGNAVSVHHMERGRFLRPHQLLIYLFHRLSGTIHPVDPGIDRKIIAVVHGKRKKHGCSQCKTARQKYHQKTN
jgi:hypothetical protein